MVRNEPGFIRPKFDDDAVKVNAPDGVYNIKGKTPSEIYGDVNDNSKVNDMDVTLLKRANAGGWNVVLGPGE